MIGDHNEHFADQSLSITDVNQQSDITSNSKMMQNHILAQRQRRRMIVFLMVLVFLIPPGMFAHQRIYVHDNKMQIIQLGYVQKSHDTKKFPNLDLLETVNLAENITRNYGTKVTFHKITKLSSCKTSVVLI